MPVPIIPKTLKEPEVFMRDLTKNWQFCGPISLGIIFIVLRIAIIIQTRFFGYCENRSVTEYIPRVDNWRSSVCHSKNHPTVVRISNGAVMAIRILHLAPTSLQAASFLQWLCFWSLPYTKELRLEG